MLIVIEYWELRITPMLVLPLLQAQVDPFSLGFFSMPVFHPNPSPQSPFLAQRGR